VAEDGRKEPLGKGAAALFLVFRGGGTKSEDFKAFWSISEKSRVFLLINPKSSVFFGQIA
jgi:hypothetical protein